MAFIPAANTAQVRILQELHGEKLTNTFYVRANAPWGSDDLISLGNTVMDWWASDLADGLSNQISLAGVQVRSMQEEEAPGVELAAVANTVGGLVEASLPGNAALVVKFLTGLTGRNRRGRVFMAGLGEASVTGNQISQAVRDTIVAAWGTLRDTLNGLGYAHVVASFYNGTELVEQPNGETVYRPIARSTALLTEVLSYRADLYIDSQRRRLAGRGD